MAKRKKNQGKSVLWTVVGLLLLSAIIALLLRGNDVILFNPKGLIAEEEHRLMVMSTLIMLGFGTPVVSLLYFFAWKYRETNTKAKYNPDSSRGAFFTFAIWGMPTIIAIILAAIMLPATQKLEPQKLIASDEEHLTVQVVALRWKWLFIYPEHNIATVNFVQLPEDVPVQFELTADETPMSSFWIPHLGGMLYAMTEHVNRLNLLPETPGDYEGSAAEINGAGFAGMRFIARVSTQSEFDDWVATTKQSNVALSTAEYEKLLAPSKDNPAAFYSSPDLELYATILSKYGGSHEHYIETEASEHEGHQ